MSESEPRVDFGSRDRRRAAPGGQGPAHEPTRATPPIAAAFRARADRWKRQLLDVSRRNRAINYRPNRGTLSLPATPGELWNTLVRDEGAVSFDARTFAPDAARPEDDERAKAAFVATARLGERARLADREQGIQVLFVALGWLTWVEAESRESMRSPLALLPVRLEFDRQARRAYISAADDDDPETNPSLAYLLQAQAGIRLPHLVDEEGDPAHPSFEAYLESVRALTEKQPGWFVEADGPIVDVFAFAKLALVDAIDRSLAQMARHPLLQSLAGSSPPPAQPVEDDGRPLPPDLLRLVLDADAYQSQAVAMAAAGQSFVIEGPPGTGKSQTITNIIAELLAQQKRVLFVAEKRVAREVVLENLAKAGIADACLHLASNAGAGSRAEAKQQVLNEIVRTLELPRPPAPPDPAVAARVAELRERLETHAREIAAPLGAGGWTNAYQLIGRAEKTRADRRQLPGIPPLDTAGRFWLDDAADLASELDRVRADHLALLAGRWRGFKLSTLAPGQREALAAALAALGRGPAEAAGILPLLPPGQSVDALTLADLHTLRDRFEALARFRVLSRSIMRFLNPAYYRTRSIRHSYVASGLAEPADAEAAASQLARLLGDLDEAATTLATAFATVPVGRPLSDGAAWASAVAGEFEAITAVAGATGILQRLDAAGLKDAAGALIQDGSASGRFASILRASILGTWAGREVDARLSLSPEEHRGLVASLGRAEAELTGNNRTAVLIATYAARPGANDPRLAPLLRFARAKRRPPLRTMLGRSREAVQLLKPCLLMSPLAAAQYLCQEGDATYRFDACIVDEASMIPTPDLVVAMSLARQAIVVGDSRQMPPTNFFQKDVDPADEDDDDVSFESVLDELTPLLPSTMLCAHYRSRDDALIAFSNVYFYDGRLVAFPDPWSDRPETGVRLDYVADAVYGRGESRANRREAERAVEFLRSELQASEGKKQVGITAMSLAQQAEILDRVEEQAAVDPVVRTWVDGGGEVRNLETVQGDECDVMILSIGYGKDADGRLTLNFGPLGKEKGERRLNVAVTRARWKTVVISSLRAGDIDPTRTAATGTLRLRDYLDYAERGPVALPATATAEASERTDFEQTVFDALTDRGLRCVPRVGVGGYRVDIGVLDPSSEGRFILGIECDGPTYWGAPSARDRELGRRGALERMGWQLERAWSSAWYRDPEGEVARIVARYEQLIAEDARGGKPSSAG